MRLALPGLLARLARQVLSDLSARRELPALWVLPARPALRELLVQSDLPARLEPLELQVPLVPEVWTLRLPPPPPWRMQPAKPIL